MKICIEGLDCSGKSTLIKNITDNRIISNYHFPTINVDDMIKNLSSITEDNKKKELILSFIEDFNNVMIDKKKDELYDRGLLSTFLYNYLEDNKSDNIITDLEDFLITYKDYISNIRYDYTIILLRESEYRLEAIKNKATDIFEKDNKFQEILEYNIQSLYSNRKELFDSDIVKEIFNKIIFFKTTSKVNDTEEWYNEFAVKHLLLLINLKGE